MKSNWLAGELRTKKRDLINKFTYKNESELPKITKISLNFGCTKNKDLKDLAKAALVLEAISGEKPQITKQAGSNSGRKNGNKNLSGSAVSVKGAKLKKFISYLKVEALPKTKNVYERVINNSFNDKTFSFTLERDSLFCFNEVEQNSLLFKNLPPLNFTIAFNKTLNFSEKKFLLSQFF